MADNTITVVGNLTRDPELKFLNSGQAALRLAIAVSRKWTNRQTNEQQEQTSYFDVQAYGAMAENTANSLQKGMRVVVTGRMEQRSWDTPEGKKAYAFEIVADEIAPSLRWATAKIDRNPRAEGGTSYAGGNFSQGGPQTFNPPTHQPFDEEPF
jgi:single-strand DNA-binding protein